jgi:hypothetical protein
MGITIKNYFPNHYLEDLKLFHGGDKASSLERGMICGLTSGILVKEYKSFFSSAHFLAVVYQLNRIDENIQVYFPEYKCALPPFPSPYCAYGHGSVVDLASMLIYFDETIKDKDYLPTKELISQYAIFLASYAVESLEAPKPTNETSIEHIDYLSKKDFEKALIACFIPNLADDEGRNIFQQFKQRLSIKLQRAEQQWLIKKAEKEAYEKAISDEAKARRVGRATTNLYNAVRRGDVKAVRALILNGGNPKTCTPNGVELIEFAKIKGNKDIINELEAVT